MDGIRSGLPRNGGMRLSKEHTIHAAGDGLKRFWKSHLDRITNNAIENREIYLFGAVFYCLFSVASFAHNVYRHRTGIENYWFSCSLLLLAIVHGFFLVRAAVVRRTRVTD
jgi:hypothetical protein